MTVEGAWADYHDRMKALGERITGPDFPGDPRQRAAGYRYLSRLQLFALQLHLEFGDPAHPAFMRFGDDVVQWGATNADNQYLRATVEASGIYRIEGNVSGVREALVSVRDGEMVLGKTTVLVERSLDDFEVGPDGSIEILLGGPEQPGNWLPLEPSTAFVQVRQFVADWERDGIADLAIERVDAAGDAPPAPPAPDSVATALAAAAGWVEASAVFWNDYTRRSSTAPPNTLGAPHRPAGGAISMLSGGGSYDLAPDEALIIECDVPDASYWSIQLYSEAWFEPFDFAHRVTSLNDQQAHVDDDGRFRVVIAHDDPGVQNWLDASGHRRALVTYRWVRSSDAPAPASTVVALADVADHLPSTTPRFSGDERLAQIASRRRGVARRFRR